MSAPLPSSSRGGTPLTAVTSKSHSFLAHNDPIERELCGSRWSALHCDARICIRDGLVKSQRLDVAAEFAQRVKPLRRAGARIAHEIIETVFSGDDDKMRDAAGQAHADDHGITARDVRIDQLVRRQVLVHVPDAIRREPRRAIPIKPALVGESARRTYKPA